MAVGYALMLAELLGPHQRFTPAVAAYWLRLRARDGYQRALAAQEQAARGQGVSPRPASEPPGDMLIGSRIRLQRRVVGALWVRMEVPVLVVVEVVNADRSGNRLA